MYLFSRQATLMGPIREVMSYVTQVTELVNERGPTPITLWTSSMGTPVGTHTWSGVFESQAAIGEMNQTLAADDDFVDLVSSHQHLLHEPAQDHVREFIVGGPRAEGPPQVVVMTTATIAEGRQADGMAWGVEIAEYVGERTDGRTAFLADTYGPFGQVTWLQGFDDLAQVDQVNDLLNTDPDYLERIVKGGHLFVPASGQRALATRVI